jgi:hypothetical protein
MVSAMEKNLNILNIDETGFNSSNNKNYSWREKGRHSRPCFQEHFENITLMSGIDFYGNHYYSIIKGSNHQWVFLRFLAMLSQHLDKKDPNWKVTTVILIDNAPPHCTQAILEFIRDNKIPVLYSGPASFSGTPIELLFSSLKRKFAAVYELGTEKHKAT